MLWVKAYAFFWLCYSAYEVYKIMLKGSNDSGVSNDDEKDAMSEDLVHALEMSLAIMSPRTIMGIIYAILIAVIAIDVSGFALAFSYPPLRLVELCVLVLVIFVVAVAHTTDALYMIRGVARVIASDKPTEVLVRYLDYIKRTNTFIKQSATCGKFIVALYLALWAAF